MQQSKINLAIDFKNMNSSNEWCAQSASKSCSQPLVVWLHGKDLVRPNDMKWDQGIDPTRPSSFAPWLLREVTKKECACHLQPPFQMLLSLWSALINALVGRSQKGRDKLNLIKSLIIWTFTATEQLSTQIKLVYCTRFARYLYSTALRHPRYFLRTYPPTESQVTIACVADRLHRRSVL